MGFKASKTNIGTEKQTLKFAPNAPDVCLVPAPPPPTGPQGIPTPFPITTTTAKVVKQPAGKVKHKNKKVTTKGTVCSGIKGNEAGVGRLPPGKPEKDVVTGVNRKNAKPIVGAPTVKMGGRQTAVVGVAGLGNIG